jgi:hypothetical protein
VIAKARAATFALLKPVISVLAVPFPSATTAHIIETTQIIGA